MAQYAVGYGVGPARWAGATYDPTSHYRAERVFEFFLEQGLTPGVPVRRAAPGVEEQGDPVLDAGLAWLKEQAEADKAA